MYLRKNKVVNDKNQEKKCTILTRHMLTFISVLYQFYFSSHGIRNVLLKPHSSYRIHSPGTHRQSRAGEDPVWGVSGHLHNDTGRKSGHDHAHQDQFPPPDTHVLLPWPPLLCRRLLFFQHHSKDAEQFPCRTQDHLLCWLLHTVLHFHCPGDHGVLHPGFHGSGPLCSHLQPSALQHQNVQEHLSLSSRLSLCVWLSQRTLSGPADFPLILL